MVVNNLYDLDKSFKFDSRFNVTDKDYEKVYEFLNDVLIQVPYTEDEINEMERQYMSRLHDKCNQFKER